ncbi:hypothetical protein ACH3VR_20705 [Microbacterium sp. B2969]|uniref:DUF2238 domain-containing protein n=1 Tax=Microbacterium alkaliflavum TaxID=3248839 RepID=A0ABW7QEK1_9MICO
MSTGAFEATKTSRAARARSSALLALPFALACVIVALVLERLGADVEMPLTLLLVPLFWVPTAVEVVFRTALPWPLQLTYLTFTLAGPFAGSALHVYWYIPRWDFFVHLYSGIMLAWLGLLIARRVEERLGVPLPRWFSLTVALFTAISFAAAWELCEFGSDVLIGTAAQHGLDDTMYDIVAGTLGGAVSIAIVLLAKRPRTIAPASLLKG